MGGLSCGNSHHHHTPIKERQKLLFRKKGTHNGQIFKIAPQKRKKDLKYALEILIFLVVELEKNHILD